MYHLLPAPLTPLFVFQFAFYLLLVFARPIVRVFTLAADEFYEFILGHLG